jgi:hypothetical protein
VVPCDEDGDLLIDGDKWILGEDILRDAAEQLFSESLQKKTQTGSPQ